MTDRDPTVPSDQPIRPLPPAPEPGSLGPPAVGPAAPPPRDRPRLGHIVTGAILVLIGVGWLLEALDITDVPWRFLLPSALIVVGVALVFGARTGAHGGLIAVGILLTVLVLAAGAIEALADIPLAGGIGDESHTPALVDDEYRWGLGKMTLDLRQAEALAGEEIEASVVLGELVVIVPPGVPLVVAAHAGVGEVVVFEKSSGGFDIALACRGTAAAVSCDGEDPGPPAAYLRLELDVAMGKVEVQR